MPTQLQIRRGTSTEHNSFTGAAGELTVDTTKDTVVVHDGSTAGGFPLARADGSNLAITNNVTFSDGSKAIFGTGGDGLEIYHDGSNSYIKDTGSGTLRLQGSSSILMQKLDGEIMMIAREDGAVELYNNGEARIATTSSGVDVTGSVTADALTVSDSSTGTLNAVNILNTNSGATQTATRLGLGVTNSAGAAYTYIEANEGGVDGYPELNFYTGSTATKRLSIASDGAATFNSSVTAKGASGGNLFLTSTDTSGATGEDLGNINFVTEDVSSGSSGTMAKISSVFESNGDNAAIKIQTGFSTGSGSPTLRDRALFASNGDINFYEDTGVTPKLFWDASAEWLGIGASPIAPLHVKGTTNGNLLVRAGSLAVSSLTGTALSSVNDAVSATTPLTFEGSEFNFVQSNSVKVKIDSAGLDATGSVTSAGLHSTTAGASNFIAGVNAGNSIVSGGNFNTVVGDEAGTAITDGDFNTALGYGALIADTKGARSVALGYRALASQNFTTATNAFNIGIGHNAGTGILTGVENVLIGGRTGESITTGNYNVIVGNQSASTAVDSVKAQGFGFSLACAAGYTTIGSGSDDIRAAHGNVTWATVSDERYKKDIADSEAGLSLINALRPRTFKYKTLGELPETFNAFEADSTEVFKNSNTNHGFIAQEVKAAIDADSSIKDGFRLWDDRDDGSQEVAEAALIPVLVKAIQELTARIETLEG